MRMISGQSLSGENTTENMERHPVEAQNKVRIRLMLLQHVGARLVTEGGLCRKQPKIILFFSRCLLDGRSAEA